MSKKLIRSFLHERQQGKCFYCFVDLDISDGIWDMSQYCHIDHAVPKSRGGSNGIHNLVLACPRCNINKSVMTPSEFVDRCKLKLEILKEDVAWLERIIRGGSFN